MWFPHQRDNQDMHTGLPWYKQSFFNPFNPNYQVATYPIYPGEGNRIADFTYQ